MSAVLNDFISSASLTLKASLINNGIDDELAGQAAEKAVDSLVFSLGGIQLYIPKCAQLKLTSRDSKIISEFTGTNHTELCVKYGLSVQRIYKIIKEHKSKQQEISP
ncbi:MAG: hypothetical protein GQ581_01905 [Methyloprofundus sp.]|nr:hypothetical protein [Methyloprofundus sp.]